MVTTEELNEKYILLDLRLCGSETKLQWMIHNEYQHGKIENRNVRDTIDLMLADSTITDVSPESKLIADEMKDFIRNDGHGFYEVGTVDGRVMACKIDRNTKKVIKDQRDKLLRDILISTCATLQGTEKDILYQEFIIAPPTFLGYEQ